MSRKLAQVFECSLSQDDESDCQDLDYEYYEDDMLLNITQEIPIPTKHIIDYKVVQSKQEDLYFFDTWYDKVFILNKQLKDVRPELKAQSEGIGSKVEPQGWSDYFYSYFY
jgi:hypothetical protein